MIYFHIVFDLKEMYDFNVSYSSGINLIAGKTAGILFILISGISCSFSSNNLKRGLRILCIGIIITVTTFILYPSLVIWFGILHFLGVSIILYSIVSRAGWPILAAAGAIVIALGTVTGNIPVDHDYLFFIGIHSSRFSSSDYYPLVPWFGVFLLGAAAGKLLYKEKKSLLFHTYKDNIINMAGRHTLPVYLLHQPVIIAILELVSRL